MLTMMVSNTRRQDARAVGAVILKCYYRGRGSIEGEAQGTENTERR